MFISHLTEVKDNFKKVEKKVSPCSARLIVSLVEGKHWCTICLASFSNQINPITARRRVGDFGAVNDTFEFLNPLEVFDHIVFASSVICASSRYSSRSSFKH